MNGLPSWEEFEKIADQQELTKLQKRKLKARHAAWEKALAPVLEQIERSMIITSDDLAMRITLTLPNIDPFTGAVSRD